MSPTVDVKVVFTLILFFTCYILCLSQAKQHDLADKNRRFIEADNYWGRWTSFSSCSSTCGPGYKARYRTCYSNSGHHHPQCVGMDKDLQTCNNGPCQECKDTVDYCSSYDKSGCNNKEYYYWSHITCPKYCGFCQSTPAPTMFVTSTPAYFTTLAPTTSAPSIDGGWTSWSPFSSCSTTCGGGSMFRYRLCTNPQPSGGGRDCVGSNRESYGCFIRPCPTSTTQGPYTNWGSWTSFGTCSVTCGAGEKVRERYRYCTDQSQCKVIGYDRAPCTEQPCPVDCQWSNWHDWSSCSVSCDLGVITRNRSCDNPAPANGGTDCTGSDVDSRECTMGQCPTWSHWFDGDCSASCGNGTRERLRHCSTGRDIDCVGVAYEMAPCLEAYCI